jgi:vitamin B12 transporter
LYRYILVNAFLKIDMVNQHLNPIQYGFKAKRQFAKTYNVVFKAQRYLRNPTFNDLYWKELGNRNLKPEYGFVYELDVLKSYKINNKATFDFNIGTYSKMINDWIIWQPGTSSFWKPENARKVWARGFDVSIALNGHIKKVNYKLSAFYSYVKSTYQENGSVPDTKNLIGKQLIYVPPHQSSAMLTVNYKKLTCIYSQQYTSWRFIQSDNFLDAFTISSLYLGYAFGTLKNMTLVFDFQVDNFLNSKYETVVNYPEQLRTFRLGLTFKFNK